MGYALAEEAVKMGAEVILVSGDVGLKIPDQVGAYSNCECTGYV